MTVVQINSFDHSSTGNIMLAIAKAARKKGIRCVTSCPDGRSMRGRSLEDHLFIGTRLGRNLHIVLARLTGLNGCFSMIDTWRFLRRLRKLRPDLIHLHNLHNCYINLPMLFRFLRKHQIPVIWTLHDCWSFTGKCPYFDMAGCDRWKEGCEHCPQLDQYPEAYVDQSRRMWRWKKKWSTSLDRLTIVTPSRWLAELVGRSFLKDHPGELIPNGIDLSVFRPTPSDWRKEHGIDEKRVVLGVAFDWGTRKGLDVFIRLAERLDESYQIVLVGTNEQVDRELPQQILSIHRTQDQKELAQIYTAADVFVNPTREENYPTVNMEAIACGTPVITFRTGGSPELVGEGCGCVVEKDDLVALEAEIVRACTQRPYLEEICLRAAQSFDREQRIGRYIELYEEHYG